MVGADRDIDAERDQFRQLADDEIAVAVVQARRRRADQRRLALASIATSCGSSQPECTISMRSSITPRFSSRSISASPPRAMLESWVE